MNDFDFWYAYFDSLFLKTKPIPHSSFFKTIPLRQYFKLQFPQCKKLPQLSKCFNELQKFIYNSNTWIECQCDQSALKQTQKNINLIAVLINIQKKYAQDFWHIKRRVQSSICHFFTLFIYLLNSLIPSSDPNQTLQNLKTSNKLCTTVKSLQVKYKLQEQQLVNKILGQINPIIQYLYQQSFMEQKKLTILFLKQIKEIFMNLPKLNKKKFKHQFQLTKYLYIIVPIELSKNLYKIKIKRKKTFTISNDIQLKYYSDQTLSTSTKKKFEQEHSNRIKTLSLPKLYVKDVKNNFRTKIIKKQNQKDLSIYGSEIDINSTKDNLPKVFQFSQKVRKYSFHMTQKKITKATLNTRQTMQLRADIQKQRKKSQFAKTSGSLSRQKQMGRSVSIQKHRKLTNETIRSKKSSFYKVHRKTVIQESQKHRHHKQKQIAKSKYKTKMSTKDIMNKTKTQIGPLIIPYKRINIYTGQSKGWGIIQQQINTNVVKKKIHELIHQKDVP